MKRFAVGCLLFILATSASHAGNKTPQPGDIAPAHIGTTSDGKPVLATDFPGKAVIVTYWATWCTFCRKELNILNVIQETAGDRVQVAAVNIEAPEVYKQVAKALDSFKILVLHDRNRKGQKAYGVNGIPHMIIIGKDGRIDTVWVGYSEDALDDIVNSINRAIGAVPADSTSAAAT